jgi:hypothetical protein
MLDSASVPLDRPAAESPAVPVPVRRRGDGERMPIIRHISGSEHGGWPLFCRLLIWATRNARDGTRD